jgi:hypothetical protein
MDFILCHEGPLESNGLLSYRLNCWVGLGYGRILIDYMQLGLVVGVQGIEHAYIFVHEFVFK